MQVICLHCKKDREVMGVRGGCFCAEAIKFWNNTKTINYGKQTPEEQAKQAWDKVVQSAAMPYKRSE